MTSGGTIALSIDQTIRCLAHAAEYAAATGRACPEQAVRASATGAAA